MDQRNTKQGVHAMWCSDASSHSCLGPADPPGSRARAALVSHLLRAALRTACCAGRTCTRPQQVHIQCCALCRALPNRCQLHCNDTMWHCAFTASVVFGSVRLFRLSLLARSSTSKDDYDLLCVRRQHDARLAKQRRRLVQATWCAASTDCRRHAEKHVLRRIEVIRRDGKSTQPGLRLCVLIYAPEMTRHRVPGLVLSCGDLDVGISGYAQRAPHTGQHKQERTNDRTRLYVGPS